MKPAEIKKLVQWAAANFPTLQEKDMRPTAALWDKMLSDIPYEVAEQALIKVLSTARFFPTVAEIREAAAFITQPLMLSPAEAWGLVVRANDRYGYYRPAEGMKSLPPLVQTAVEAMGGFREICISENVGVTRGQFMKIYDQYASREKEMSVLPKGVRQLIGGVTRMLPK